MDTMLVRRLSALNTSFYARNAQSFASTRHGAWAGWASLAQDIDDHVSSKLAQGEPLRVVDLAAGNLRFEAFMEESFPHIPLRFTAVDNCTDFPSFELSAPCEFRQIDLIESLEDDSLAAQAADEAAHVVACFGFLQHVPSLRLRKQLLSDIADMLAPDGLAFITLWNFIQDESLLLKAQDATAAASAVMDLSGMEDGDYILGWQGKQGTFRYCHSFSDEEVDQLIDSVAGKARVRRRFRSDGRTGKLNTYLVLQKIA